MIDSHTEPAYSPTERSRVKRLHQRGHYDKKTVHAILDSAVLCHVGYVIDGQPFVTPTCYWRKDEHIYWHGSAASRMLRAQADGIPVCLTVSHIDGLVMARSAFHHSINYRSAMVFGKAQIVTDIAHKREALHDFVERIAKGRSAEIRTPNDQELKATSVMMMEIEEASAKVRTGGPVDDEEDYALPVWAGVIPLKFAAERPIPDDRMAANTAWPNHLDSWKPGSAVDQSFLKLAADQ